MNSIKTERLLLRKLTADDLPKTIELRADPLVSQYLGGKEMQSPEAVTKRFWFYLECYETHGYGMYAVIWKETGEMIGWSGLQPLEDTGETEVGYGFAREFWGRGLATECARAWLEYGFNKIGLERIVAVADPENTASHNVMEKLGMLYEKTEPHYGTDCVVYAISKDEFLRLNSAL